MKKSILNLGKALNKAEQKNVLGGWLIIAQECLSDNDCSGLTSYCYNGYCLAEKPDAPVE